MEQNSSVPIDGEKRSTEKVRVSRRDFLKGAGATTAAAAVATTAVSQLEAGTTPSLKGIRQAVIHTEVNRKSYRLTVKSHWTLLDVLRNQLHLTGTKKTCDRSSCGACTVIMDGKAVYACSLLALEADKRKITTIEALSDGENIHPIQQAFLREDGLQCGFCTPGQIMSTKALLDSNPRASLVEIKEALSGNICRCAAYPKITKAVLSLVQKA